MAAKNLKHSKHNHLPNLPMIWSSRTSYNAMTVMSVSIQTKSPLEYANVPARTLQYIAGHTTSPSP